MKKTLFRLFVAALICTVFLDYYSIVIEVSVLPLSNYPNDENSNFLVHTPACSIPNFKLDDPSIVGFKISEPKNLVCSEIPPLTYVDNFTLYINRSVVKFYPEVSPDDLSCCYKGIRRVKQSHDDYDAGCDNTYSLTDCTPVLGWDAPDITEDGILVLCHENKNQQKEEPFYQDIHTFLQPSRAENKTKHFQEVHGGEADEETLSFLIVLNDAVSRLNMRRHMPKTFHYLTKDMDAIDFQGYNKVADNTDPNMLATLMGMDADQHKKHTCGHRGEDISKYDDCPLIWKDFSSRGYVTGYAEDSPWMGLFHYLDIGYVDEPTDYYNRPYFLASDELIGHSNEESSFGKLCQGSRRSIDVVFNFALDFTKKFEKTPYFGMFLSTSLTHDYLQHASAADEPNYNLLKTLNDLNLLNRTILLFMSDHGQRWGSIRSTYIGMLEERLPYVMMVFPKWFKNKYPDTWSILKTNSRRLVSNFDLFLTMQDVANKGFKVSTNPASEYGAGQSLFLEVPANRTCEDARIPEHFCACQQTDELNSSDPSAVKSAEFVVQFINAGLQKFNECSPLKLNEILNARRGSPSKDTRPEEGADLMELYYIVFSTVPGDALFDATVKKEGDRMELSADVSRINAYGDQSSCITDDIFRKYCYCEGL